MMKVLLFLLGFIIGSIFIIIISCVLAYKEMKLKQKLKTEIINNTKKPVGRPKKTVKKGE